MVVKNPYILSEWFGDKPQHDLCLAPSFPPSFSHTVPHLSSFSPAPCLYLTLLKEWNCLSGKKAFSQGLASACSCIAGKQRCIKPDLVYLQVCFVYP